VARKLPALPSPEVPMFGADGTMNPIWRQFWQNLLLYVSVADLVVSPSYANDAAAAAGGVQIGEEYRNGSVRQARVV